VSSSPLPAIVRRPPSLAGVWRPHRFLPTTPPLRALPPVPARRRRAPPLPDLRSSEQEPPAVCALLQVEPFPEPPLPHLDPPPRAAVALPLTSIRLVSTRQPLHPPSTRCPPPLSMQPSVILTVCAFVAPAMARSGSA
jgi:hypothetical protein